MQGLFVSSLIELNYFGLLILEICPTINTFKIVFPIVAPSDQRGPWFE
jgi:hypothetical protein